MPAAKPGGYAKHVVLRVDRADGFVGRNFLARGAREHTFYNEEVDGILLDRVKFFWGADYGHLSFTSDHNLVENCEGLGAGDAVVYPGAAPETGSQATDFYPDAPRPNTVIRDCDLHGSTLGYSGSMGNAVRITSNHIYGNTTGISSDTLSAAGHPGFPADSSQIDHNYIYSNNLDLYTEDPPVDPLVGVPIGTGIIYPGMNDARVHDNWIFDNWRDGAMLFAVPDALTNGGGAEGDIFPGVSCPGAPANGISTSCGNQFFRNRVGRAPNGFRFPDAIDMFGNVHAHDDARPKKPNGNDFWWSELFTLQHRELLVRQHGLRRDRGHRHRSGRGRAPPGRPAPATAVELRHQRRQQRLRQARLPGRLRERSRRGHRAHGLRLVDAAAQARHRGRTEHGAEPSQGGAGVRGVARGRRAEETGRRADPLTGVSRSGRTMLVLVAAAVALPACGGDDEGTSRDEGAPVDIRGVGLVSGNSTAQFANCRDWRRGSVKQRYATIEDIRGQLTPQRSRSAESDLSDEAAYKLFQHACAAKFSDKLRLYKLYAHAQAFAPLTKDAGEADPAP